MHQLHRREVLRGAAGVALSLPWLEAMAVEPTKNHPAEAPPKRVGFVHIPNGMYMSHFQPTTPGKGYAMPYSLQALEPFRAKMNYYSGLDDPNTSGHNYTGFLSGTDVTATPGYTFRNTASIDQVIANSPVGLATRFPSIYVAGSDSKISWTADSVPLPPLHKPQDLYTMLFVEEDRQTLDARIRQLKNDKRLLDSVLEESNALQSRLGAADRRKIDEYLTAVRGVEKDLARLESWMHLPKPKAKMPQTTETGPFGTRRLMLSVIALALQADLTRAFAFSAYDDQVPGHNSHHGGSHCGNEEYADLKAMPANHRDFVEFNKDEATIFADFVAQLADMPEGDGTVLDNSCMVYGSAHRMEGHHHRSVPLLSVGSLGGKLRTGSHIELSHFPYNGEMQRNLSTNYRGRPIGDFHLTLLRQIGLEVERHGTGTRMIDEMCA